ncbi:hypothetical protein [Pseudomonas fluorescens]|uniref:Uncharacterized protein n=1 Tax=Pseudomonas fluorescens TaxID=294 RepID=A0A5E7LB40_PSEFL|nr:hypothetical protein [Pseudomonas fluorescens]VVP08708.1 hypothetical protein PS880_03202 [Pseudomonas fluorescens]
MKAIPENLATLHAGEEELWAKAVKIIENDPDLSAHVDLIERVMDLIQFFVRNTPFSSAFSSGLAHLEHSGAGMTQEG